VNDKYLITDKGLVWIKNYDASEPAMLKNANESIGVLKYLYENFKGKRFRIQDLKQGLNTGLGIEANLKLLARKGYLASELKTTFFKEYSVYRINPDKDAGPLFDSTTAG
jgi:hypothetical protein